jgi:membrane protease YdiL (CAAX protease family)
MDIVTLTMPFGTTSAGIEALRLLVLAPLLEELIFRSGLQEALLRRSPRATRRGAVFANVITATLFALCHFALQRGALSALTLFPALAVGWIYQRTRRLAPCVAAHAAMNAMWLVGRHFSA